MLLKEPRQPFAAFVYLGKSTCNHDFGDLNVPEEYYNLGHACHHNNMTFNMCIDVSLMFFVQ